MHLRFDGTFGFAGKLIDRGEDVVVGLNREMVEVGWSSATAHPVTWAHYYNTQVRRTPFCKSEQITRCLEIGRESYNTV